MARLDVLLAVGVAVVLVGNALAPDVAPSPRSDLTFAANKATETGRAVEARLEQASRLYTIANSLFLANADQCSENVTPWIGFYGGDIELYDGAWRRAMTAYGLGGEPTVLADVAVSPLYEAGLRRGDVLKAVNGVSTRSGRGATAHVLQLLQDASRGALVEISYASGNTLKTVRVPMKYRCRYNIVFDSSDQLKAYSSGEDIVVSAGLIRFTADDEELALVVAHEMAHIELGHKRKGALGVVQRGMDRLLAGAADGASGLISGSQAGQSTTAPLTYDEEVERRADYLSLYYLARAGVKMTPELSNLWRRLADLDPRLLGARFSHRNFPGRFERFRETVSEIRSKRLGGEALVPRPVAD